MTKLGFGIFRLTPTLEELETLPLIKEELSIKPFNIKDKKSVELLAPLKDKVIVNFGDSIFGNYRPPYDVSTFIANRTGAIVHNCGFGGCEMGSRSNENFNAFGMVKLAESIATNDFAIQDTAITNSTNKVGSSLPSYYADSLALLKSIDFNKVDYITIAYGTNDYTSNRALDNAENKFDTNTFGGALRYAIETILTTYPHIKIFVCSLIWRFWLNDGVFESDAETKLNGANLKISDYNTKITEVADEYHLPFIDNYSIGFNKFNRSVYFPENDGTHPNETGRELLAKHIASKLF
jgi:lysophospholipase L1-like esterase